MVPADDLVSVGRAFRCWAADAKTERQCPISVTKMAEAYFPLPSQASANILHYSALIVLSVIRSRALDENAMVTPILVKRLLSLSAANFGQLQSPCSSSRALTTSGARYATLGIDALDRTKSNRERVVILGSGWAGM